MYALAIYTYVFLLYHSGLQNINLNILGPTMQQHCQTSSQLNGCTFNWLHFAESHECILYLKRVVSQGLFSWGWSTRVDTSGCGCGCGCGIQVRSFTCHLSVGHFESPIGDCVPHKLVTFFTVWYVKFT